MSSQYLNATTPNLSQKIRVYSAVVKENLDVEGEASVTAVTCWKHWHKPAVDHMGRLHHRWHY